MILQGLWVLILYREKLLKDLKPDMDTPTPLQRMGKGIQSRIPEAKGRPRRDDSSFGYSRGSGGREQRVYLVPSVSNSYSPGNELGMGVKGNWWDSSLYTMLHHAVHQVGES